MANVAVTIYTEKLSYYFFLDISSHSRLNNRRGSITNARDWRLLRHALGHAHVNA